MAKTSQSELFDTSAGRGGQAAGSMPLAARMRPRTLDEFVGQQHIVGPGRLLRRAIQADQLTSVIFYGPPGTGKTTLAQIIANTTQAQFTALNAVLAGVANLRKALAAAAEARDSHGRRTILFIDEVHRWNKAQQDALLPSVENGTIIFVGATTENPYFEVIKPLVSRSRIFQLVALERDDLAAVARGALHDAERGLGAFAAQLDDDALEHLLNVANGDARSLLNALELAVTTTPADATGKVRIDRAVAEESIQRRAVLYDKEGDAHYDTISAFIKSLRGSDPDAALYWMARMVYAGEDPRYLFRRMLVLAAEDVGMADPQAMSVVTACAQAFDYVGLPEGRFHLAEAALYLATAPKSNSTLGFFDAIAAVGKEREQPVPSHLRDGNRDAEGFGHGAGYNYPHAYEDHWVAQQYLPRELQGRVFYQPSASGHEAAISAQVQRRREASLAAMFDDDTPGEILTNAGRSAQRELDRWLARSLSDASERLGSERDLIVEAAQLERHSVALDLALDGGLLTFELIRRCPEGGVFAVATEAGVPGVSEQLAGLPAAVQPRVLQLTELETDDSQLAGLSFDAVVGRNALRGDSAAQLAAAALRRLAGGGRLSLAEAMPEQATRIHEALDSSLLPDEQATAVVQAEDEHYQRLPATEQRVRALLGDHLAELSCEPRVRHGRLVVTPALVERWFASSPGSYAAVLRQAGVDDGTIAAWRGQLTRRIGDSLPWQTATLYVTGRRQ